MYPQVQLRPFIPVINGQPPVYPAFSVNPNMQRVVGFIGSEIINALQNEATKNIVRSTTYNYISDNNYNNQMYQDLYKFIVDSIEFYAMSNRQDPAALLGHIPNLVRLYISHIWVNYVKQPLDNETRSYVENSYREYQQMVQTIRNTQFNGYGYQNNQYNQFTPNNQYQQNNYQQNGFNQNGYNPMNPVNNYNNYNQVNNGYNQYNQNQFNRVGNPVSGDRFSNYNNHTPPVNNVPRNLNSVSPGNAGNYNNVPMASNKTESRFSPIDNQFNRQMSNLDRGFEKASQERTYTAVVIDDIVDIDTVFGNTNTVNTAPTTEKLEWYPTESQRHFIVYSPFKYECIIELNEKGHPIQTFKRFKLGDNGMKEDDHIIDIINRVYTNGPKPSLEEAKRIIALEDKIEANMKLKEKEKEEQLKSAIVESDNTVVSIDSLALVGDQTNIEDNNDVSIVKGVISDEAYSTKDHSVDIDYLANATSTDQVISKLMKLRKSTDPSDIKLYYKLYVKYARIANTVINDVLGFDISFDDLVDDFHELVAFLEEKIGDNTFVKLMDKYIADVFINDEDVFIDDFEDFYTSDNTNIFYNRLNTPTSVAVVNHRATSLLLPDTNKVVSTKDIYSPVLNQVLEIFKTAGYSAENYIHTLDNKRYAIYQSAWNPEVYYLKLIK